jgi:hypothetical protein
MTGAYAKNPQRRAGKSRPKVRSLGPAPKRFTAEQVEIWNEFNADFPWLGRSDRALVEVAVNLMDQLRTLGVEAPIALYAQMRMVLGQMGGTPVDRSKVMTPGEPADDPADEFFN